MMWLNFQRGWPIQHAGEEKAPTRFWHGDSVDYVDSSPPSNEPYYHRRYRRHRLHMSWQPDMNTRGRSEDGSCCPNCSKIIPKIIQNRSQIVPKSSKPKNDFHHLQGIRAQEEPKPKEPAKHKAPSISVHPRPEEKPVERLGIELGQPLKIEKYRKVWNSKFRLAIGYGSIAVRKLLFSILLGLASWS